MSRKIFARNLKYLRKQKEWSQEAVAKRIYVDRSLVALIETERATPNLLFIERACLLFELDILTLTSIELSAA